MGFRSGSLGGSVSNSGAIPAVGDTVGDGDGTALEILSVVHAVRVGGFRRGISQDSGPTASVGPDRDGFRLKRDHLCGTGDDSLAGEGLVAAAAEAACVGAVRIPEDPGSDALREVRAAGRVGVVDDFRRLTHGRAQIEPRTPRCSRTRLGGLRGTLDQVRAPVDLVKMPE